MPIEDLHAMFAIQRMPFFQLLVNFKSTNKLFVEKNSYVRRVIDSMEVWSTCR